VFGWVKVPPILFLPAVAPGLERKEATSLVENGVANLRRSLRPQHTGIEGPEIPADHLLREMFSSEVKQKYQKQDESRRDGWAGGVDHDMLPSRLPLPDGAPKGRAPIPGRLPIPEGEEDAGKTLRWG